MKTIERHNVKIFTDIIDKNAIEQIKQLLSINVFADKKIRIMPDVHAGAGCVIGFTGDLGDKVIPNIVGVDIGCGMRVLNLGNVNDIDYHGLHEHIRTNVPSGKIAREDKFGFKPLIGEEMEIYREAKELIKGLYCYRDIGNVYLVIHTGSRNLGLQVANIYQEKAIKHLTDGADDLELRIKEIIEKYKATGRRSELKDVIKKIRKEQQHIAPALPTELCYVEGETRKYYLHDMSICQQWAVLNRKLISILLLKFFNGVEIKNEFESVHNYISDDNMIRKGAISAAKGELCIIPLNMRDGSLICVGKGNTDWNCSAPHGAGRILSRNQAYEQITMKDFESSMNGIYSESINEFTRDEAPMVYKPIEAIIDNIGETVTIETIIRPIFNFKAM